MRQSLPVARVVEGRLVGDGGVDGVRGGVAGAACATAVAGVAAGVAAVAAVGVAVVAVAAVVGIADIAASWLTPADCELKALAANALIIPAVSFGASSIGR